MRKTNTIATPHGLAASWLYQEAVTALRATMHRPEYYNPGPGMPKKELVRHLIGTQALREGGTKLTDMTIRDYVKMMAAYGLLDAAGMGKLRRYYPPGYLRKKRPDVLELLRELAEEV